MRFACISSPSVYENCSPAMMEEKNYEFSTTASYQAGCGSHWL